MLWPNYGPWYPESGCVPTPTGTVERMIDRRTLLKGKLH